MSKEYLHDQLYDIRGYDVYANHEVKKSLLLSFFPDTIIDMINDMSNVTSAFYGFLLKNIGETLGKEKINEFSEKLFYNLGKLKTEQALIKDAELYRDTRAFAVVAISAIYNASPEYIFSIDEFTAEKTVLTLTGVDRYYRVCHQVGIDEYVKWPTLLPFIEAIKDTLQVNASIEYNLSPYTEDYKTNCVFTFKKIN